MQTNYDIVKAHGGELRVETLSAEAAAQAGKEGEGLPAGASHYAEASLDKSAQAGSEFIILLPLVWTTDSIGLHRLILMK